MSTTTFRTNTLSKYIDNCAPGRRMKQQKLRHMCNQHTQTKIESQATERKNKCHHMKTKQTAQGYSPMGPEHANHLPTNDSTA